MLIYMNSVGKIIKYFISIEHINEIMGCNLKIFSSVQFSHSVVSDSL